MNYQILLNKIIEQDVRDDSEKTLLLHACCAPCSSYCLEYLAIYYKITVYFYNPNITKQEEYEKRAQEIKRFIELFNRDYAGKCVDTEYGQLTYKKVELVFGEYNPNAFFDMAKGLENVREGGARCKKCYDMRLQDTAIYAMNKGYDYFSTSLSISPHKNAEWLNGIGEQLAKEYGVNYLYADFKKKNGYKRSIELSQKYDLYRQNFCGCIYSKQEN